eukprot:CAMPEP_0197643688 /NCGR_PEP_ID=MMETSP1338-20131121/16912_1 /TAXON_ID=43686 ORGANISM="Pelagodinium beii, Strain RCC1491" /NCGR_SAMPLE_ID=MMETSP1338 /ASSEMBLY_ACC=CAM_ASM_000754 /LENGTH=865 /DNA_ID=CAMNT_0043216967 /DNA_START=38 /DNA_END=2633 /DNA_ORIENTATION=-
MTAGPGEGTITIYFGTQTGRAEAFAHELSEDSSKRGLSCRVVDLEEFSPETFASQPLALLLMSNTGDGEPTDNAVNFYRWLVDSKTPTDSLKGMAFAVFGLGDRHYVNFNRVGKVVDERLEALGAKRLYARGVGDESKDIVSDFSKWKCDELWKAVEKIVGPGATNGREVEVEAVEPLLRCVEICKPLSPTTGLQPVDALSKFYFQASAAKVSRVVELRQKAAIANGESTVHIEIDVSGNDSLKNYAAGGTLEILPQNCPGDVEELLPLLGLQAADLNHVVELPAGSAKAPFPMPCTLREALTLYCDLRRAPSRRMLLALKSRLEPNVRDSVDRLLSDELAMRILQDEGLGWTQCEFWAAMGVQRLDVGAFLLHCPRQRSRPYTIASSPCATPDQIHVVVSLLGRPVMQLDEAVKVLMTKGVLPSQCRVSRSGLSYGVCSKWMCSELKPSDTVLVRVRPSSFQLVQKDVPLVMIGAGAGVAPFRAFWAEIAVKKRRSAPVALFFGCRHPEQDWIYRSEMEEASSGKEAVLSHLFTAFSRQDGTGAFVPSVRCGRYVQDMLRVQSLHARQMLAQGGVCYLCGANAMGEAVLAILGEVLEGGPEEVQKLQREGRLIQELWGSAPAPLKVAELLAAETADVEPEKKRRRTSLEVNESGVLALIEQRRSIFPKDYTGLAVPDNQVQKMLEAARWAPTHGKTEPWRFVVFSGEGRNRLIDATLDWYASRDSSFWKVAWNNEFKVFADFKAHVERQRTEKWLKCSHLVSICMRRQQPEVGKRQFPEHEEVAAVACAVQNMHLAATSMRVGAYWSSWFEHFTGSAEGVKFHNLCHAEGDRWMGIFCIGQSDKKANIAHRGGQLKRFQSGGRS